MRFEDERYVRIYTRDTTTVLMLSWEERAVMWEVFRKVDRAGLLDLGEDGLDALAANLRMPVDVIERAMPNLLRRKVVELRPGGMLVVPRFVEAQESKASDKARARSARERARDAARAAQFGVEFNPETTEEANTNSVTPRDETITQRDDSVTARNDTVTRGHTPSHGVTLCCAVPSRTEPDQIPVLPSGVHRLDEGDDREVRVYERYVAEWRKAIGGTNPPKLTPKRRRLIRGRLREGFSVEDLERACVGLFSSDFHMGDNEKKQRWIDIELLFRDVAHVEKFIGIAEEKKGREPPIHYAAGREEHMPANDDDATLFAGAKS